MSTPKYGKAILTFKRKWSNHYGDDNHNDSGAKQVDEEHYLLKQSMAVIKAKEGDEDWLKQCVVGLVKDGMCLESIQGAMIPDGV
ncbi:hypothetical protein U1Q18_010445 [Sarracenia purpurea var. burkii]